MNKQYSPLKPHRSRFHEEWLIAILLMLALFQIGFSFHESARIARPDQTLSVLPMKGESVAKQPRAPQPAPRNSAVLSLVRCD